MRNPLKSPYYTLDVILARGGVNLATLIWCGIVLWYPNALAGASYGWITGYISEDVLGVFLGVIALVHTIWLLASLRPWALGAMGYALLTFCWGFVLVSVAMAKPIQLTAVACVSVVTLFAFYGFIANPKVQHGRAV